MSDKTAISWADRTANGEMGCAGCELSIKRGDGSCYAEALTQRAGQRHTGYPSDFYSPKLFLSRYEHLLKLPDLVGHHRPDKPWLDHLPQVVFHNDMGDAFSPGLELDWWHPFAERFAAMKALHIWLTKWPSRMRRSFELLGYVPQNFLLGTSLTSQKTDQRAVELLKIRGARRWLSVEPNVDGVDVGKVWRDAGDGLIPFEWAVDGGQSGPRARPYRIDWAEAAIERADRLGMRLFVKQLGAIPMHGGKRLYLVDRKGEDWTEWPESVRRRDMPPRADGGVEG